MIKRFFKKVATFFWGLISIEVRKESKTRLLKELVEKEEMIKKKVNSSSTARQLIKLGVRIGSIATWLKSH